VAVNPTTIRSLRLKDIRQDVHFDIGSSSQYKANYWTTDEVISNPAQLRCI
jgi:hypothetical protein